MFLSWALFGAFGFQGYRGLLQSCLQSLWCIAPFTVAEGGPAHKAACPLTHSAC